MPVSRSNPHDAAQARQGENAVAIIGMACRFCGAPDLDAFWRLLVDGREGMRPLTSEELRVGGRPPRSGHRAADALDVYTHIDDALSFDAEFFGYAPHEAALLDPQHRVLLEACWHALEDARVGSPVDGDRVGIYAGVGFNSYLLSHVAAHGLPEAGTERWRIGIANDKDTATSRVAYKLGLTGPAVGVQTACSSSLVAVHLACQAILDGDCEVALAGGSSIHFPQLQGYVHSPEGVESRDGHCRPFSGDASGTVFTDGVGVVVLRRLADAIEAGDRVYAVISGSAINNDASDKVGYTAPSVSGQVRVLQAAHGAAGIDADDVAYIETHGTGTAVGDAIELKALGSVFSGRSPHAGPCLLGAVKGNIGHADAAAGVAGLIKTALCLHYGLLPATMHAQGRGIVPSAMPLALCAKAMPWQRGTRARIAGISSFGIGGTNAHVVLAEAPPLHACVTRDPSARAVLLPLQGQDEAALDRLAQLAIGDLRAAGSDGWQALAGAFQARPRRGAWRRALVVAPDSTGQMRHRHFDGCVAASRPTEAAWLLPGQGSQFVGMARGWYAGAPDFAQAFDDIAGRLEPGESSLCRRLLLCDPDDPDVDGLRAQLDRPSATHLCLLVCCWSLAQHFLRLAGPPRLLLGHSLGEVIAAALAGVWTIDDAIAVVRRRGRLLEQTTVSAMLALETDTEVSAVEWPEGVTVGCFNGPRRAVVCGDPALLDQLAANNPQWVARRLPGDRGFHSPAVASAVAPFQDFLSTVPMRAPRWPILSCVTGSWMDPQQACSPAFWAQHLRLPVRFDTAATTLLDASPGPAIELGPGHALSFLTAEQPGAVQAPPTVPSLSRELANDPAAVLHSAARLWTLGVDLDFTRMLPDPLPHASARGYPFARVQHVYGSGSGPRALPARPAAGTDGPQVLAVDWHQPSRRMPLPDPAGGGWLIASVGAPPATLAQDLKGPLTVWCDRNAPVQPGIARFDFAAPAQWEQAFAELEREGPLPRNYAFIDDLDPREPDFARGLARALGFARALTARLAGGATRGPAEASVHWVTRALFAVHGADIEPARRSLWGVARVLPQECEGLRCWVHDLEGGRASPQAPVRPGAIAGCLLAAPAIPSLAPRFAVAAWRGGQPWTPSIGPITPSLDASDPTPPTLRRGGRYLVTGGANGVGLAVSRWLCEAFGAEVVASGRRPADELPAEWGELVRSHPQARYVCADVASAAHWEAVAAVVPDGLRGLHGVFHCAGVAGGGLLAGKELQSAFAVIHPKVAGTEAVLTACEPLALDFVVLFGSINSWYGGLGQADYASANAFLDACAEGGRAPWRLLTIAWDTWLDTGMARRGHGSAPAFEHRIQLPAGHWLQTDHRVDGATVLPAAASLCFLLQALAAGGRALNLEAVRWLRPAAVDASIELDLAISAQAGIQGLDVEIRDGLGSLCQARAVEDATVPLGWGLLRREFPQDQSGEHCDSVMPARLEVGGRWRCVGPLRRSGNFYRLELHAAGLEPEFDQWPWHPALVDAAMLAVQVGALAFSVPHSIQRVWGAASLRTARWSDVHLRESNAQGVLADVAITDERDSVLLWLEGVRFVPIVEGALDRHPVASVRAGLSSRAALHRLDQVLNCCAREHVFVAAGLHDQLVAREEQRRRAAWPVVGDSQPGGTRVEAGDRLAVLCRIIALQLGYAQVDPEANFFALGGDSLSGLQVIALARQAGIHISLAGLYRARAIADVLPGSPGELTQAPPQRSAPFLLVGDDDRAALPPGVVDAFPLSMVQQGVLYYRSRFDGQDLYRDWLWADLDGPFDADGLARAWRACVRRHPVLRTEIDASGFKEQLQLVYQECRVEMTIGSTGGLDVAGWIASGAARNSRPGPAVRPFALAGRTGFHIAFLLDDALVDGWSSTSLLAELLQRYAALLQGRDLELPAVDTSFHDYVQHERQSLRDPALRAFWREHLDGCEPLVLCSPDRAAPPDVRIEQVPFAAAAMVDDAARRLGIAAKILLLSAYAQALALWTRRSDVTFGVETHTRLEQEGGTEVLGVHLNMLPMRVRSGAASVREFVSAVGAAEAALIEHRDLPLGTIQQDWAVPLFDNCFNFTSFRSLGDGDFGAGLRLLDYHGEEKTHYPFKLWVDRDAIARTYVLYIAYDSHRIDSAHARGIATLFGDLVAGLAGPADACVSTLGNLAPAVSVPPAPPPFVGAGRRPVERTVGDLFAAACGRFASRTAVRHGGQSYTYAALRAASDAGCSGIRAAGVPPGGTVAIQLERSFAFVAIAWAVWKAGARVLLLDFGAPALRIAEMLRDAPVDLVIADASAPWQADTRAPVVTSRSLLERRPDGAAAPDWGASEDMAAYVIFTSGSTGRSKGVVGTHRGLLNRVQWQAARYPVRPGDRCLVRTPSAFGDVFWEIVGPLCAGATLVIADDADLKDPARISSLMALEQVTHLVIVPVLLAELVSLVESTCSSACGSLRQVSISGELLRPQLLSRAMACFPDVLWLNLYGSSEVAADVAVASFDRVLPEQLELQSLPVGEPIDATSLFVLDEQLEPVQPGTPGELYVSGAGLAHGYLGRPSWTASRFLPNPWATGPGDDRLFRTGDLARHTPQGLLILGRADRQVKIRGARVNLDGVEARLTRLPGVRRAAAVVTPSGLAAFIEPDAGGDPAGWWPAIRDGLHTQERPVHLRLLEQLPLTSGGKIDRVALEALPGQRVDRAGRALAGDVQQALALVWRDVLGVPEVFADSRFDELGGHSLLLLQLERAIERRFAVRLGVARLLEAPSLSAQARLLEDDMGARTTPSEAADLVPDASNAREPFQPTDIQQAYWVARQIQGQGASGGTHLYQEWLIPALDPQRLEVAWNRLVARHDMLRATIGDDGFFRVGEGLHFTLPFVDLSTAAASVREDALSEHRRTQLDTALRPDRWPLFDLRVFRVGTDQFLFSIKLDFIILDGWSAGILARELWALYFHPETRLAALALGFRDVQEHRRLQRGGPAWDQDRQYWEGRLADLPGGPELPMALASGATADVHVTRRQHVIDAGGRHRLEATAAAAGLTLTSMLLAVYAAVLQRWSSRKSFTLTMTLFDRPPLHPQVNDLVGDFTTVLLLEVAAPVESGLGVLARAVHDRLIRDLEHRDFNGIQVGRLLRRESGPPELMRYVFTSIVQEGVAGALAFPAGSVERFRVTRTAGVWIDNQVVREGDALRLHWDSLDGLFPQDLVQDMFCAYCGLVDALASTRKDPLSALAEFPGLPASQLLRRPPLAGETPAPDDYLARIADRCRNRPQDVAVIAADREITYGQLWREATRFAATLRAAVKDGEAVAVHLESGWRQIVAVLAAGQVGLPYVPLSTRWPQLRLEQVIAEHGIVYVIADARATLPPAPGLVRLEVPQAGGEFAPADDRRDSGASSLAYVIFTSGSTGSPKGVMMRRAAVSNTLADMCERLRLGPADRVLCLSDLGFDLSVFDIFGVLMTGGALVMPSPSARMDPGAWWGLCQQHRVTVWNSVPALFEMLADFASPKLERLGSLGLRWVLLSGDWIPLALPALVNGLAPQARLLSLGGATEAGIWSVCYPVVQIHPDWRRVPYGRPLKEQSCSIVDEGGQACPDWVLGELLIHGASLADGYWHRHDLTAASFTTDAATGQRAYRTGDLARWRGDGVIELVGRKDSQVKILGHRVECMEIEHVIASCEGVLRVVVLALEGPLGPELHAVVEALPAVGAADLRQHCSERLPEWMVPHHWHCDIPIVLSENGKIDRRRALELVVECRADRLL